MIIKDSNRYYPLEIERIVSARGRIIYDRDIWCQKCPLADCERRFLTDCNGDVIYIGRFDAQGKNEYFSAYSAQQIDNFIAEAVS